MDMFKLSGPASVDGAEVDLDDLDTYPKKWLEMKFSDLHFEIWSEMGTSLFYMQFFHPDVDWGSQEERVHKFCREYVAGRKEHFSDLYEDRLWCYKILYRFLDEVENQC